MEQHVAGSDIVAVQVAGDHNTVTIAAGTARLTLEHRHELAAPPATERELLMAELRATTLVGRADDLAALRAWLVGPRPVSVRCLAGRAGAGKSRLAIELCGLAAGEGWTAGFARREELRRLLEARSLADWRWPQPTLVVVDYAAASAEVLRAWLQALARRVPAPGEPKLRLLLLERHASAQCGWWADLLRGGLSGRGPEDLADPMEPAVLASLPLAEDRRALLAEAMRLAARLRGRDPALQPPTRGADPAFDRRLADITIETEPLFLVMAGLTAVETGAPAALALGRTGLAERVAQAERLRLERLAEGRGLDPGLATHLAACATLEGGCTWEDAEALVAEEWQAMGFPVSGPAERIVSWLAEALPPATGEGVDAVRPDVVGEAFLLQELGRDRRPLAKQRAIVERAWRRAGRRVVATVIRTAQDHAGEDPVHPSLAWFDHVADLAENVGTLMAVANELPRNTLALRERGAGIEGRIVAALTAYGKEDPGLGTLRAAALNNFAARLYDLGRAREALDAAREVVALYRMAAARNPEAGEPGLAGSLNNLATYLGAVGLNEEALGAADEASTLFRAMAAREPEAFAPDFAMALTTLAGRLADLGQWEKALAANREAVTIRRSLAEQRPDQFAPDLALSLNNLAACLGRMGRTREALPVAEEALAIRRSLAAHNPDAFAPDLAGSLVNVASCRNNLGLYDQALVVAQEAVTLCRVQTEQHSVFAPDLARCLAVLANSQYGMGYTEAALAANAEAVAVLSGPFLRAPATFVHRMQPVLRRYVERCKQVGCEPDAALLEPVLRTLRELGRQEEERR